MQALSFAHKERLLLSLNPKFFPFLSRHAAALSRTLLLCPSSPPSPAGRAAEFLLQVQVTHKRCFSLSVALPPSPTFCLCSHYNCIASCFVLPAAPLPAALLAQEGRAASPEESPPRGFPGKDTHGWAMGGLCCQHLDAHIPLESHGINYR